MLKVKDLKKNDVCFALYSDGYVAHFEIKKISEINDAHIKIDFLSKSTYIEKTVFTEPNNTKIVVDDTLTIYLNKNDAIEELLAKIDCCQESLKWVKKY